MARGDRIKCLHRYLTIVVFSLVTSPFLALMFSDVITPVSFVLIETLNLVSVCSSKQKLGARYSVLSKESLVRNQESIRTVETRFG